MHNSDDSEKQTAFVRLYMDESGTSGPGNPHAIVAGLLINRLNYMHFEESWEVMLKAHGVEPPLHMKEFGKHGKFGSMSSGSRRELFVEVAELINSHKIASISASLTNREYEDIIPAPVRDKFGVYGMCFQLAAYMNHKIAEEAKYAGRVPFVLDSGNAYAEHVRHSHATIMKIQNSGSFMHAGGLYFDSDSEFGVLQAADVIAWGSRRQMSTKGFPPGLEPIESILTSANMHNRESWKSEWLQQLCESLLRRMAESDAQAQNEQEKEEEF